MPHGSRDQKGCRIRRVVVRLRMHWRKIRKERAVIPAVESGRADWNIRRDVDEAGVSNFRQEFSQVTAYRRLRIDSQTTSCYGSAVIQKVAYCQRCRRTRRIQKCETGEKLRVRGVGCKGKVRTWRRCAGTHDKSAWRHANGCGSHCGSCGLNGDEAR